MQLNNLFEEIRSLLLALAGIAVVTYPLLPKLQDRAARKAESEMFAEIAASLRVRHPTFKTCASIDLLLPDSNCTKDSVARRFREHDKFSEYQLVRLDLDCRRLAVYRNGDWIILPLSDIMGAEIISEGSTITYTGGRSSFAGAAVGGALFGPAGMIVGGLGGATTSASVTHVSDVRLRIFVVDPRNPVIEAPLHRVKRTMGCEPMEVAREWVARINAIVHENARLGAAV